MQYKHRVGGCESENRGLQYVMYIIGKHVSQYGSDHIMNATMKPAFLLLKLTVLISSGK